MKQWMTVIGAVVVGVMTIGVGEAPAQTTAPPPAVTAPDDEPGDITSEIALTRAAIQVRRQALVTAVMDFEAKEAEAFWPLYREYRLAMARVNDGFVKLVGEYLGSWDKLTDDAASRMLNEYLGIERARTAVKTEYVPKFGAAMPARKVARFFQIDNKLDAVMNAELARMIPLAR
jgi:hypothetical protein